MIIIYFNISLRICCARCCVLTIFNSFIMKCNFMLFYFVSQSRVEYMGKC